MTPNPMTDNPKIQRCYVHDYREPCIYLLTVTVEGRRPVLGRLAGDVHTSHIELTPLGEDVRHELYALCDRYPQLKLLQYQIMPDHVHVILQVTERLSKPLGSLFSSWKIACGRAYARGNCASAASREVAGASTNMRDKAATKIMVVGGSSGEATIASQESPSFKRLFAEGYNDSILSGKGQLQRMIAYVRDNPRRLLLKRNNNALFAIQRKVAIAGYTLDAVGNTALLRPPHVAVHCRYRWTDDKKKEYIDECLKAAHEGTILIGAFISKEEQAIAHAAHEQRLPLIHLVENGFHELYKPVGQDFYACAEGRLLQLAPWEYHAGNKAISREQCNALNTMAETIAAVINAKQ